MFEFSSRFAYFHEPLVFKNYQLNPGTILILFWPCFYFLFFVDLVFNLQFFWIFYFTVNYFDV
jgi:hypothetical protein